MTFWKNKKNSVIDAVNFTLFVLKDWKANAMAICAKNNFVSLKDFYKSAGDIM